MGGGFGLINTGEDCLHLSVHVPVQDEEEGPLAVMVSTIDNVESTSSCMSVGNSRMKHTSAGNLFKFCCRASGEYE